MQSHTILELDNKANEMMTNCIYLMEYFTRDKKEQEYIIEILIEKLNIQLYENKNLQNNQ